MGKSGKKPKFFWQAALILLPVLVLAGVAFLSLRQDRRLAQSEAAERAQSIADELSARLWNAITQVNPNDKTPGRYAFQVDTAGQLLFPSPNANWPAPQPLEAAELKPEQARAWQTAHMLEMRQTNLLAAAQSYTDFLDLDPP